MESPSDDKLINQIKLFSYLKNPNNFDDYYSKVLPKHRKNFLY